MFCKLLAAVLCCQFSVSVESVPVFSVTVDSPAESPKTVSPDPPSQASRKYLACFTSKHCGPCQTWKQTVLPRLKAAGYHVELVDMDLPSSRKYADNISRYPSFVVCDWGGKWLSDVTIGGISFETAHQMLGPVSAPVQTHRVQSRNTADQPANYTEAERQKNIEHLLTHRTHTGKFTREYLESLSGYELIDLHNADHGVPTVKGVKTSVPMSVSMSPPARYIQWPGWGQIDLETYNRNCDCSMCVSIRAKQQEYRRQMEAFRQSQTQVTPDQEGCPHDVVESMLDQIQLRSDDVLADLGCGDGRILLAAGKRGIRGIGVEIDPARAEVARRNVAAAGLEHLVTIETGDALEFDTSRATVVTAYLYPPLLAKLEPKLRGLRVVASPYHEIPGLKMTQAGEVWIYSGG